MVESQPSEPGGIGEIDGTLRTGEHWHAWTVQRPVGVVLVVHGAHEHLGRYRHVAERLAAAGYAVFAVDHLGHGRSPGVRGNIGSMDSAVAGVDALARLAAERHPGVALWVYGHSLGGLIALQYLTGPHHADVRGGIISAPALDTSSGTAAQKALAPVLSRWLPNLGVLALDAATVSRDPRVVEEYRTDPLVYHGKIRARTATEIMMTAERMPPRLAALRLPLLLLHGTADRLMPLAASEAVRRHAQQAELTVHFYEGFYHEPHNEPEQAQVLDDIVRWLDDHSPGTRGTG